MSLICIDVQRDVPDNDQGAALGSVDGRSHQADRLLAERRGRGLGRRCGSHAAGPAAARAFFAHLALEKMLRAHVCRKTRDLPPRLHQLLRLAERTDLTLSEAQRVFLARFDRHFLEGRYPGTLLAPLEADAARQEMQDAREMFQWLIRQL